MRLKMEHVVIALFFLLSLYMIVHHEAWRDEAQPWLIARDSPSFLSVVRQMNREGTPGLWFYMAYPLARAGLPFFGMQLVNLLIVLCIVAIVMRCRRLERTGVRTLAAWILTPGRSCSRSTSVWFNDTKKSASCGTAQQSATSAMPRMRGPVPSVGTDIRISRVGARCGWIANHPRVAIRPSMPFRST